MSNNPAKFPKLASNSSGNILKKLKKKIQLSILALTALMTGTSVWADRSHNKTAGSYVNSGGIYTYWSIATVISNGELYYLVTTQLQHLCGTGSQHTCKLTTFDLPDGDSKILTWHCWIISRRIF
ncbi:MAG: hypothetical protein J0H74_18565 [Chitinophagaceae bacterium]|nr:hypothetical protein [Chitinophagaceae bacterium]